MTLFPEKQVLIIFPAQEDKNSPISPFVAHNCFFADFPSFFQKKIAFFTVSPYGNSGGRAQKTSPWALFFILRPNLLPLSVWGDRPPARGTPASENPFDPLPPGIFFPETKQESRIFFARLSCSFYFLFIYFLYISRYRSPKETVRMS